MTERQLERIENQNKIFDSDSISSDSEESKGNVQVISAGNSFENSREEVNRSSNSLSNSQRTLGNNTKTNTTAKSAGSSHESSNLKALQESLENF